MDTWDTLYRLIKKLFLFSMLRQYQVSIECPRVSNAYAENRANVRWPLGECPDDDWDTSGKGRQAIRLF